MQSYSILLGIFVLYMKYSIIVAVFNRPHELDELLESLTHQTFTSFEVIVVEDGSTDTSEEVCKKYQGSYPIYYYTKQNTGPGLSRNFGCRRASGDYFIFLDSDCTVPTHYLQAIDSAVHSYELHAFGGPDREHDSFSPLQKAISFAMTSVLTTGGIRGSKRSVGGKFHPRSFNMGISREVFNATEGFSRMRFGEDVDFSMRIIEGGFNVSLIPEAWVYHKRRTSLKKFYKQVFNSGNARINLSHRHPGSLKVTHMFPMMFVLWTVFSVFATIFEAGTGAVYTLLPVVLYSVLLWLFATIKFKSLQLGVLSVAASWVQLWGYGLGFIRGFIFRTLLGKPEGHSFEKTFYS